MGDFSGNGCGLKRSMQHLLEVYSQESRILEFFLGVDSSAARPNSGFHAAFETHSSAMPLVTRNTCPSGCRTCISRTFQGMLVGGKVTSSPAVTHCL